MNFKYITKTTIAIAALIGSFNLESLTTDNSQLLLVHKTATCGCCKQWIKHLEKNGFSISTKDHQSLQDIKESYQIKSEYRSCHTGVSKDGYIFEGHIPSKYITQFLSEEHSNAIGLSVPGMPLGSPGMEFEGKFMPYDVLILFKDGTSKVYAEVRE
tara:strand:- start:67 stop:537 length:471 start_codon:yes stop_codon:yes gene_type:complete